MRVAQENVQKLKKEVTMKGSVALNIRNLRKKKGITQGELAQEINLCRNTIVNFENERRDPRVNDLKKIARALDVPVEQLISDDRQEKEFSE